MINLKYTNFLVLFALAFVTQFEVCAQSMPVLDTRTIINESYNFLKNREPEMTDSEYALYEQVLPMVFDRPDFALTLLETMLADDEPESAAFAYVLANVYFSDNRYELAEKHYRSAVRTYSNFIRAWINLGILYYTQGKFQEAIPCLIKAISLGNTEAQIRGLLGYCLKETDNPIAAEATFLQAFAADPTDTSWIEALLSLYLESEQYGRAELLTKQLIKLEPEKPNNWRLYASILLSEKRKVDAITVLEIATSLGFAGSEEQLLLGDLYAEQKLFPEALETYKIVMKKEKVLGAERLLAYVQSLIQEKSYDEAEILLASLGSDLPQEKQIHLLQTKASLFLAQKQWNAAAEVLTDVLDMDPLNGQALVSLGRILKQKDDLTRATLMFQQANHIPEFSFQANVELANIALMRHQYRKSVHLLEEALRIEHNQQLEEYLVKIKALVPDNGFGDDSQKS